MTFEEHLRQQGFTDADFNDPTMKPIIERFRPAYEATAQERDRFKTEYDSYRNEIENEFTPSANARVKASEDEAVQARLEAARLREEVKIARDYGLLPKEEIPAGPAKPTLDGGNMPFDPKAHKLVTYDDVSRFADQEARAIAMAYDVGQEYEMLTGRRLHEYVAEDGSTGMTALMNEAKKNRATSLRDYAAKKFQFKDLRAQKAAEAQKAREDAIRKEEGDKVRMEMASQYGNPNMRTLAPSRQPFIPAKAAGGKMPWETTSNDRKNSRIERALQNQAKQHLVQ
jgi:hypothetical protein